MSIFREHGEVVFRCDECKSIHNTETKDFEEALTIIQTDEDWTVVKDFDTDKFVHMCPDCAG